MDLELGVVLKSDRAVVLRNVSCNSVPKHFVVIPKENIENLMALKRVHLPLLHHMLELAVIVIDQLPSNFRIGFKSNAYMNRINMHVISDDIRSNFLQAFNKDLFIPFNEVYANLLKYNSVEAKPKDDVESIQQVLPTGYNRYRLFRRNFLKCRHNSTNGENEK